VTFSPDELTNEAGVRLYGSGYAKQLNPVPTRGWYPLIREPFSGAWQQNLEEKRGTVLCYPTLYACISRISQDVGKLPFLLKKEDSNGIWQVDRGNTSYWPVLRKPNHYQTAQQFREAWMLSKLIHGNTYVLKRRDARGVVDAMFVLDPCRVKPLVSDTGDVFYELSAGNRHDSVSDISTTENVIVPAREIIHDRLNTFHHQLIGVPPLCAAHWPAVKNLKILRTSAEFFENKAQPGGILTAPAGMSDDDAVRVQNFWQQNYTGQNAGKVAVIGADLKYQGFATSAADSQLVEQMRYSDEQICQPFGIPPFIIGIGTIPAGMKVDDMANMYYQFALQAHIEAMEYLLDEGLGVTRPQGIEIDLDPLLRMDQEKRANVVNTLVSGKVMIPNEGRQQFGLPPTAGGDTLWGQNQDYPLGMLADRAEWDPAMQPKPEPTEPVVDANSESAKEEVKRLSAELWQRKALEATREAINA